MAEARLPHARFGAAGLDRGQPVRCRKDGEIRYARAVPWPTSTPLADAVRVGDFIVRPCEQGHSGPWDIEAVPVPLAIAASVAIQVLDQRSDLSSSSSSSSSSWDASSTASIARHMLGNLPFEAGCTVNRRRDWSLGPLCFQVVDCNVAGVALLDENTDVVIAPTLSDDVDPAQPEANAAVGGLHDVYQSLYELLVVPLDHRDELTLLGADCPKGLLLYGPPGVGKTMLVREVSRACHAVLVVANASDIVGPSIGSSEENLRKLFARAQEMGKGRRRPSVLFLDELDVICPVREGNAGGTTTRLVGQLLTLMDGLEGRGNIVVIGATNRPNTIDPALRRPGRFDREIAVGVPNVDQRHDILRVLASGLPLNADVDLGSVARACLGFVGADLAALVRDAAWAALRAGASVVTQAFLENALAHAQPSILRDSIVKLDRTVRWDDIGGLEEVQKRVRRAVEWPIVHRDAFKRLGLRAPRGVLLYGPPGCSKTTLVKAMAASAGATFLSLSGAAIYSPFVGDAEATVRELFARGRSAAPSVLFFDEIDAIVSRRSFNSSDSGSDGGGGGVQERVLSTLLNEMDGIESAEGILVVAATNRPDMLDAALLRPGRFDEIIYVPPPDERAREAIFSIHTRKMKCDQVNLAALAAATEHYSGADIENVCREAAMNALRASVTSTQVTQAHFDAALDTVPASLPPAILSQYQLLSTSS